jgi:hypothetical protein
VVDGGIDIFKFHHRWHHRQTFDHLHPEMAVAFHHPNPIVASTNVEVVQVEPSGDNDADFASLGDINNEDFDVDGNASDDGSLDVDKENVTALTQPLGDYVSFQQVVSRASDLAGTCQHDQPKMRSLLSNINEMIDTVRDSKDIHVHFDGNGLDATNAVNRVSNAMLPRTAVAAFARQATTIKRKQGRREFFSRTKKRHRTGVTLSQVSNSNDGAHLPPPKSMTRSCLICCQKGHGQGRCPRITMCGVSALEKGDEDVCQKLSQGL